MLRWLSIIGYLLLVSYSRKLKFSNHADQKRGPESFIVVSGLVMSDEERLTVYHAHLAPSDALNVVSPLHAERVAVSSEQAAFKALTELSDDRRRGRTN